MVVMVVGSQFWSQSKARLLQSPPVLRESLAVVYAQTLHRLLCAFGDVQGSEMVVFVNFFQL